MAPTLDMRPLAQAVALLIIVGAVVWPSIEATAQAGRAAPAAEGAEGIVREWVLRGVVISEAGRSAVFEQVSSGRQERVTIGAMVGHGIKVVAIDPDRVVLDGETGTTVTLRLGHGGQGHVVRRPPPLVRQRPVPPFRRVPPSVPRR